MGKAEHIDAPPRTEAPVRGVIGQSVPRVEDRPLVIGAGRFAGDLAFARQLHMRVVRSAHAHAKLVSIDTAAARAMPGVAAIWTGTDVVDVPRIPLREGPHPALDRHLQPVLAQGEVRYVGEPVAVVFADDPYRAEDAAERVVVEVEPRAAVLHADREMLAEPTVLEKGFGDLERAFRDAHATVSLELAIGRHSGVPLETRGLVAHYDESRDMLELHGAAKIPHRNRETLARVLGRPPSSVQLFEWHVGGGFGIRGELYPEDILACLAAMRLKRPVKWIEDRHEHMLAANQSREQIHRVRAAVDRDGRILAIEDRFFHDQGAYVRTHGDRVADMTAGMLLGPYEVGAYRGIAHYRLTNKTPAATYRSPGRFESTFVRERLMDAIAARLAIDPVELRRRNLIPSEAMPYPRGLDAIADDVILDSGDYAGLLDRALAHVGWPKLRAELAARRARGELVGAGLAMFVEKSGLGPTDGVRITVDAAGAVEVVTGGASIGQGFETVIAQICADTLGVDYRKVRVVHGRTDRIDFGIGAHATRATVMTGSATHVAAQAVRAKALDIAAELLRVPRATLDIIDGKVVGGERALDLADLARALAPSSPTRGAREPGLCATGWFNSEHMTYPYGAHLAVVKVDPGTAGIAIERFFVAYDVGRAINLMLVEGQIAGGVAQGIGGALLEEFVYDEAGVPNATTFADYLMPTATDVPRIEVLLLEDAPSPRNPLGIKGAGEAGINGVGAAIAAAIDDAIGKPGAVTRLPVTPERLRSLLQIK